MFTGIDWEKTLAIWVAIATIVQAVVAMVTLRGLRHSRVAADAANATLALTDANAVRQLRAYMTARRTTVGPRVAGQPWTVQVKIRNSGQTPALNVRGNIKWAVVAEEELAGLETPQDELVASSMSVGSGNDVTVWAKIPSEAWEPEDAALSTGAKCMIVVGFVIYQDIYQHTRRTDFRMEWDPHSHPKRMLASGSGNSAT